MFESSPGQPSDRPVIVRQYRDSDEPGWLRCSILAFLDTAYFDSVFRCKPRYDGPSIELVAESNGAIVGVIDVEYEETPGAVCTVCADDAGRRGGMIWHLAVHPDFQHRGIGTRLLREARRAANQHGITCFEVWTRDDAGTLRWYEAKGFQWVKKYLHVYLQGEAEVDGALRSSVPGLRPVHAFAHYVGPDDDVIRARFERVHDCNCFRLIFAPEPTAAIPFDRKIISLFAINVWQGPTRLSARLGVPLQRSARITRNLRYRHGGTSTGTP